MEKLLQVKNLRVSFHNYAGEIQSVRGVSFDIFEGESIAIVGESGCGKTVTSKAIMGLIQCPPGEIKRESSIIFNGKEITSMKEKELEKYRGVEMSMIFQDPMTSLNPTMTVGDQIAESFIIHKNMNNKDAFRKAVEMLKLVGISNAESRAKQYPFEFSGGMRQRVIIAMALACNPKLLIADEPTTALDVTIQAQVIDLMKELQKKFNTAIILITHDLGIVADISEKVIVMYAGQIVERGLVDEIFYSPQHPYTIALLKSVPRLDIDNKNELVAIKGTPPDLIAPPMGCSFASRCQYCMDICKEQPPQVTNISETHSACCWLHHPFAPKIDIFMESGGAKIG